MGQWHKLEFNIQTLTLTFRVRYRHTKRVKKGTKPNTKSSLDMAHVLSDKLQAVTF